MAKYDYFNYNSIHIECAFFLDKGRRRVIEESIEFAEE